MNLLLSEDCPIFDRAAGIYLAAILGAVAKGWHSIARPAPPNLRALLSPALLDLYGQSIAKGYKRVSLGGPLLGPEDCTSCVPERLSEYLSRPTILLVENARNDGAFIAHAAARLSPRIARKLQSPQAFDIRNAGGNTEMTRELTRLGTIYSRAQVSGLPKRIIAVTDSDGVAPGLKSKSAAAVAQAGEAAGIHVHVLRMRTIENYVPDQVLIEYGRRNPDVLPAAEAISRLPAHAHDHYPIKEGLPAYSSPSDEAEHLYPQGLARRLGMGDKLMAGVNDHLLHLITKAEIQRRDHESDLTNLVDTIEANL